MQVAIAGLAGVFGGGDQRGGSRGVTEHSQVDHLLDPGRARLFERTRFETLGLAQQRGDDVGLAELEGQLGRGEQPPGTLRGLAELGGAPQRGERDAERSAAPCASARLLEFGGDVFVRRR